MKQEDKDLLLKDLCARLPYHTNLYSEYADDNWAILTPTVYAHIANCSPDEIGIKPYLFPLSSMTEEQQEEFDKIYADDMQVVATNLKNRLDGQPYETNFGHYRHIDWLNAHHFDYRGLIEKGLAINARGLNIY